MIKAILSLLLVLLVSVAHAQSTPPFYGTWTVTWEGKKQIYDAKLVLAAQGGTWKTSAGQRADPCVGREVPVKVDSITPEEAQLTLAFSEALNGCKDSKVVLKSTAAGVTGTRGGIELTLKRD